MKRGAWALAAATILAACGGAAPSPAGGGVMRLIEDAPAERLELDSLWREETVFRWRFERPEDLELWRRKPAGEPERGRLRLDAAPQSTWRLARALDRDAGEVQAIRVKLGGLGRGQVSIAWAGPDEPFSARRTLVRKARRVGPEGYAFRMVEHPLWRGPIARLRVTVASKFGGRLALEAVEGVRQTLGSEDLAAVLARPFQAELDAEVRNARLALPGVPIAWPVKVPAASRLELGYGLQSGVRQPVVFRVTARAGAAPPRVLFEDEVRVEAGSGWRERRIDLAALAGEQVELAFETVADRAVDPAHGFALWANPEIVPAERLPGAPPNLVLISVDTLRADHLSLYGYPRETSPRLDAWARRRATVFRHAVAPAPWTLPSHVSMLSGLDALGHGVNHRAPAPAELVTLAEHLRRAGYRTHAITDGGWLHPFYGLSQGFDVYRFWPLDRGPGVEVEAGVDRVLAAIEAYRDRPFFLFLHTFNVHEPYRPRHPYFERFYPRDVGAVMVTTRTRPRRVEEGFAGRKEFVWAPPEAADPELLRALYDSGIRETDDHLGRLLERLEAPALGERTAVVLTSDHGEALGEKGRAGHTDLYEFNLMVPLVVGLPGGEREVGEVDRQVRVIDVAPTLLELAGVAVDPAIDGRSLLPLLRGQDDPEPRRAWSYNPAGNTGLSLRIDNRLKYLWNNTAWAPLRDREEVYDLRREPGEERDLAPSHPDLDRLRELARETFATKFQGLVLSIENGGGATLAGTVGGPLLQTTTVKTAASPPTARLEWEKGRRARFAVEPGSILRLFLEGEETGELALRGRLGDAGFEHAVPLPLAETWRLAFDGAGWAPPSGEAEAVARVTLERRGAARAAPPPEADAALVEQLRALGYVE